MEMVRGYVVDVAVQPLLKRKNVRLSVTHKVYTLSGYTYTPSSLGIICHNIECDLPFLRLRRLPYELIHGYV